MGTLLRIFQCGLQAATRRFRNYGFVGFDDINMGSGFAQFAGNDVACDFGADQQNALPFYSPLQAPDYGFGNVFPGHDVDIHAALLDRFLCRRADGGDPEAAGVGG